MKVCSLYGAGFYYVPGTDICLKVGAYIRAEYAYGTIGSSLTNLDATGTDGQRTRTSGPDYQQRARAFILLDSRQQTAYGTLRAYLNIGHSTDFPQAQVGAIAGATPASGVAAGTGVYFNRAFIQLAGFTWGLATSYYDFYSSPATSYSVPWSSDTGDSGYKVAAYTAQLGNGLSATLSLEEQRRTSVTNNTIPGQFAIGALPLNNQEKVMWPDIVGNLRLDQAWGSAQIMGAIHSVGGGYFGTVQPTASGACSTVAGGTTCNGAPEDKIGFALGAGIKINFPMFGPGDYFQGQVNYAEGATRYVALTPAGAGSPGIYGNGSGQGSSVGYGFFSDAVFCGAGVGAPATAVCPAGGSTLQLTTAWGVNAAYEHYWTPTLRTSLVGAYTDISYNGTASAQLCGSAGTPGAGIVAPATCGAGSFDFSYYSISSRTQWNITKDFYIGLEGYYGHLNTMSKGQLTAVAVGTGAQPTAIRQLNDQDVWVYRMRVHRDIVP